MVHRDGGIVRFDDGAIVHEWFRTIYVVRRTNDSRARSPSTRNNQNVWTIIMASIGCRMVSLISFVLNQHTSAASVILPNNR